MNKMTYMNVYIHINYTATNVSDVIKITNTISVQPQGSGIINKYI